ACAAMRMVDDRVGVSFGIAEWPYAGPSKDSLLAAADMNLYVMKRDGSGSGSRTSGASTEGGLAAATADAQRQRHRLAAARRLSVALAPLRDEGAVARATVEELHSSFGVHLVVQRLDLDDMLRPVAGAGFGTETIDEWEQAATTGLSGRAARTGEPVMVGDTANDPDFIDPGWTDYNPRSVLVVPLRVGGDIWGVLNIESSDVDAFGSDDLIFSDLLAGHVGAALERCNLFDELESALTTTLAVLSDALERKDAYTAAHADEVADLTVRVGRRLGFAGDALRNLNYGGLLHDIGKIGIRSEILQKPAKLTPEEFEEIKEHTNIGADMLARIPFFEDVVPLVRYAHERWDGNGYPTGLAAEAIPLGARIICACDAYNAMVTERPYKSPMPPEAAIAELRRTAGTQFDPVVVDTLIAELQSVYED
ncbi:MAG: HD domain-containing phosphohydrolase, partial [Thermoleophilaceae bacterium]